MKVHANEDHARATAEVRQFIPGADVFTSGVAEEMVASCDVFICQWSTLAFVGVALGKIVHSAYDPATLRALLPLQNGCAAHNIAANCQEAAVIDASLVAPRGAWRSA